MYKRKWRRLFIFIFNGTPFLNNLKLFLDFCLGIPYLEEAPIYIYIFLNIRKKGLPAIISPWASFGLKNPTLPIREGISPDNSSPGVVEGGGHYSVPVVLLKGEV